MVRLSIKAVPISSRLWGRLWFEAGAPGPAPAPHLLLEGRQGELHDAGGAPDRRGGGHGWGANHETCLWTIKEHLKGSGCGRYGNRGFRKPETAEGGGVEHIHALGREAHHNGRDPRPLALPPNGER